MLEIEKNEFQIQTYQTFKAALDGELQRAAEGFVKIGWLLKQARDTDILHESGYANVNDFAMAEYGIDKSVVSRYIRINDKFSEGGNSPYLMEQYREFGYAKLAIMIQLPEEISEELTPDFSKSEIQTIHEEIKEEQKLTDIEVMLEDKNEKIEREESMLGKAMIQLWHDEPELYLETSKIWNNMPSDEEAVNSLAPSGAAIYTVRIPGTGRIMISIKTSSEEVTLTNVRSGEKESYAKKDLIPYLPSGENAIEIWESKYEESWPIQEEIKEELKEAEPKKETKKPKPKVTKAKEKEKVAPVQPDKEHEKDEVKIEVVPGVTAEIEDTEKASEAAAMEEKKAEIMAAPNHTEEETVMQEAPEVVYGEVENLSDRVNTRQEPFLVLKESEYEKQMNGYKDTFENILQEIITEIDNNMFSSAGRKLDELKDLLSKMKKLEDEYEEE